MEDEGRPLEADRQGLLKPLQAATVKSRGGERCRKRRTSVRQVRFRETSASEPLMKCRKVQDDVENRWNSLTWDEPGGRPDFCPDDIRHEGGVTLNQASAWNMGTCRSDAKGEIQAGGPRKNESTDESTGAEQPVIALKVL